MTRQQSLIVPDRPRLVLLLACGEEQRESVIPCDCLRSKPTEGAFCENPLGFRAGIRERHDRIAAERDELSICAVLEHERARAALAHTTTERGKRVIEIRPLPLGGERERTHGDIGKAHS